VSKTSKNYKIFWFGEHTGRGGVGFAVHKKFVHLVRAVRGFPDSDRRLITMDILIQDSNHPVTLICAYSPTIAATKQAREKFYSRLRDIVTPRAWLLGDLNARAGRRPASNPDFDVQPPNIIGPCSLKGDTVPNENSALLLDIASDSHLRHCSSHFVFRDSKRWTWRHPRYGSRAVLDHMFMPALQL
jgi:exonuclease III